MQPTERVLNIVSDMRNAFENIFSTDAQLIWFGSWVKGDAHMQSDIDLAIHTHVPDAQKFVVFRQYVDDYPTLYGIDIINLAAADVTLQDQIRKHGRLL